MSLPTFSQARGQMLEMFWQRWVSETPAATGGPVPGVLWPGGDAGAPPPADSPWARVTIRHSGSRQATLGEPGNRRFVRSGLVIVQVFGPLSSGGLSIAEKLGIIAREAFEGRSTASGIWFRNARLREVGPDGAWYQMNMTVDFEYDELH